MADIWYKDPRGFLTPDNVLRFFPIHGMSLNEQLNSIVRFALYFTILVILVARKFTAIYFLFFVMALTAFVSSSVTERLTSDVSQSIGAVVPTVDNPFMNILWSDYKDNPTRDPADDVLKPSIKTAMDQTFSSDLYRDANDIFNKQASDRQFYTTPITTIPNDQQGFAEWLYYTKPTCKERTLSCGVPC